MRKGPLGKENYHQGRRTFPMIKKKLNSIKKNPNRSSILIMLMESKYVFHMTKTMNSTTRKYTLRTGKTKRSFMMKMAS